jgi:thioredoxin reductase
MLYDLAIIGAGPAGISAAIHAKRFGLNFVLLEKGEPGGQARAANLIENFPGYPEGISGRRLMDNFLSHAICAGAEIIKFEVKNICPDEGVLAVKGDENIFQAKAAIVATGLAPIFLSESPWMNVYYYPVPDKIIHEGKDVLIVGGGDAAFDEAISFAKKAASVTIAMRSQKPKALQKLVDKAVQSGAIVKTGMSDKEIAKLNADVVVACIGKTLDLRLIDSPLLDAGNRRPNNLHFCGDIAHPDIRHIAAAVGDGVTAVEKIRSVIPAKAGI